MADEETDPKVLNVDNLPINIVSVTLGAGVGITLQSATTDLEAMSQIALSVLEADDFQKNLKIIHSSNLGYRNAQGVSEVE